MRERSRRSPGFGLIQLVAAVAIVALLVTVALPVYRGIRSRAYLAEVRTQARAWKALAWAYYVEHGSWQGASDAAIGWDNPPSKYWDYGPHQYGPTGAPQDSWFVANLKPGILAEGIAFAQTGVPDYVMAVGPSGTTSECGSLPTLSPCSGAVQAFYTGTPAAPTNLAVTGTGADYISLSWQDNANNEQDYVVRWRVSGASSWTQSAPLAANTTSYTVTGLQAGTTYDLQVAARNSAGEGASQVVQASTAQLPPAAPTNLTVTGVGADYISLSWQDNASNEQDYVVEWRVTGTTSWTQSAPLAANTTSYTVTGLQPSTSYDLRVAARNSAGSSYSGIITFATASQFGYLLPQSATASATYNSSTANVYDGNYSTGWSSGGYAPQWILLDLGRSCSLSKLRLLVDQTPSGTTRHRVYGGPSSGSLALLYEFYGYTSKGQWLEWTPQTPISNVRYIKVETVQSPSWVAWFEIEPYGSDCAPNAPRNLGASGVGQTSVFVSWQDASSNEIGYRVRWRPQRSTQWAGEVALGANATSYTVTGLQAGTVYEFQVAAYNQFGESASTATGMTLGAGVCDEGQYGVYPWLTSVGGWSDPGAHWIWDVCPPPGPGYGYVQTSFTLSAPETLTVYATVDNSFILFVDNVQVLSGDNWTTTYQVSVSLSAGTHTVKVKAYNSAAGPAGILVSVERQNGTVVAHTDATWSRASP